jgi:hypothetical protein
MGNGKWEMGNTFVLGMGILFVATLGNMFIISTNNSKVTGSSGEYPRNFGNHNALSENIKNYY